LESLGPQAPIVHDMRESLADFLAQPAAAVAVAPKAKPTAKPPVHGKPKPKPATHPKPAAHGQPKPKPKQGKPKPKPAKQPQPPPDFEKTEAMLFVAARQAEARSDFATAERTHRERIVLFEQARGPRSGPAFGARRHLVKCLMLAKDRAGAVEELRSLAADTEAARGPSSPLVCEILFEFGVCALEAGDTRGLERAKEALSRFKALGREDKVAAGERRLKRATNPRSRPKHS
jgi:hypothetical protein